MEHPGFKLIKDAFKKAASKYDADDLKKRVVRTFAAGGEAAVDRGLKEFPKSTVEQMVGDFYDFLTSPALADSVSATVRALDESTVKGFLDQAAANLQQDENALKLAKEIKKLLDQAPADQITGSLEALLDDKLPPEKQMLMQFVMQQVERQLEQMENMDVQDIARTVQGLAESLPTDLLAAQFGAVTREFSPDRINNATHKVAGNLPSSKTVSDIMHGIGDVAKKHLKRAVDQDNADAPTSLEDFRNEAMGFVAKTLQKDQEGKKKFDAKKGGDFKL